jgi:hypothetical protein
MGSRVDSGSFSSTSELATPSTSSGDKPWSESMTSSGAFNVFSQWNVGTRYMLQHLVGQGAYGEVAVATDNITNEKVAIKRMPKILNVRKLICL